MVVIRYSRPFVTVTVTVSETGEITVTIHNDLAG